MENEYYYTEGLCYLEDHVEKITDRTQESIDTALSKNGAVGVAGGYYEEGLPLAFISKGSKDGKCRYQGNKYMDNFPEEH